MRVVSPEYHSINLSNCYFSHPLTVNERSMHHQELQIQRIRKLEVRVTKTQSSKLDLGGITEYPKVLCIDIIQAASPKTIGIPESKLSLP